MSIIEDKITFEFKLKTPYIIISSADNDLGHQILVSSSRKSGKTLLFWNDKQGFYHIVGKYESEYSSIEDLLRSSLIGASSDNLKEFATYVPDNFRLVRGSGSSIISRAMRDGDQSEKESNEGTNSRKNVNLIELLQSTREEDVILLWWVHIACRVLSDFCLVFDGNLRLPTALLHELEKNRPGNPVILLTTKNPQKSSEGDESDFDEFDGGWTVRTDISPVIQVTLESEVIKGILCDILAENHISSPSKDIQIAAARAMIGIKTTQQVRNIYSRVIAQAGKFGKEELKELYMLRDELVGKHTDILSPVYVDRDAAQLGGMNNLKEWIKQCKPLYSPEAKAYGLHPPKGVILCGPPGTGKTACAKYIAYMLDRPLIIFNIALAFRPYVGESEMLLKNTLEYLDSLGDIVVLLDEVDRFIGETIFSHETTRRITAAFLTWQSNRANNVFVITASNSLSTIPPEFTRAGRFDKVYYVDLPGIDERAEILGLHLKKRNHGYEFEEKDLQLFAAHSGGFSGAELEAVVETALMESYERDKHLCANDILSAIKRTKPLSFSRLEDIKQQRVNAKNLACPASSHSFESEVNSDKMCRTTEEDIDRCYC